MPLAELSLIWAGVENKAKPLTMAAVKKRKAELQAEKQRLASGDFWSK